ncbi:hypothetical protein [Streptomyces sp. Ag109_O5-1]|uniref:hypothetical protein n=1 Tax=Streptomyces sp. Ag109_O5-1 TaxID=1938851 RepID=UPI0021A80B23|nr:hypothetical protein [Streptomyces sp. Ag109_O5-1]
MTDTHGIGRKQPPRSWPIRTLSTAISPAACSSVCSLTDLRSSLGVTLLHPADRAGQAAFSSWGWQNMGEVVGLPGPVAPCVLTLSVEGQPVARR